MCGEKLVAHLIFQMIQGSPPRVRGKALPFLCCRRRNRITPACAGKSGGSCSNNCTNGDHPRVCGEKYAIAMAFRSRFRITPACAGKSRWLRSALGPRQDHPRVCGEKENIPLD